MVSETTYLKNRNDWAENALKPTVSNLTLCEQYNILRMAEYMYQLRVKAKFSMTQLQEMAEETPEIFQHIDYTTLKNI